MRSAILVLLVAWLGLDAGAQPRNGSHAVATFAGGLCRVPGIVFRRGGVLPGPIRTPILPAQTFFAAADEHQDYYRNHPLRYRFHRFTCGRNWRLEELWGSVNLDDVLSSNH